MSDVFISYARPTLAQAQAVAQALRGAGFQVWFDEDLPAHRPYSDVIEERLRAAKAVVVLWSAAAARSEWVRSEANLARQENKLVQLSVDGARLPMPFDQIQCPDLTHWSGDDSASGWRKIVESVAALVGEAHAAPAARPSPSPSPVGKPSVAVLPFRDLSPERDQDYFCEGAAEEIICALAELPGLRVAGRSAAFLFKQAQPDGRELGRLLDVDNFLEGSVRKSGDRVRIGVRLVSTSQNVTLWAKTFERRLSDIFAVQEEIARAIVEALNITLLDTEAAKLKRQGTRNLRAYELYLRGRQLMRRELDTERHTAAEFFREATRLDPQFALAFAGLADVLVELARRRMGDPDAVQAEAIEASERALALAPDLAEAHIARGNALRLLNDPESEAAFEQALALSPQSAELHYAWARFLVSQERRDEAVRHYERAFELAPDDYRYIVMALQEYQALGDQEGERSCLERSWAAIERRLEIDPEDVRAYDHGAGVLALLGRKAESSRFVDKALAFRPDDYGTLYTLACAAMLNGEPDRALDLLDLAVGPGRGDKAWLLGDHDLAPLHDLPRFEAIVQRMA
jgi:adenylate cyclase